MERVRTISNLIIGGKLIIKLVGIFASTLVGLFLFVCQKRSMEALLQVAGAVSALFAPLTLGTLSLLVCMWYASLTLMGNILIFSLSTDRSELWYGCAAVSILSAFFYVFFLFAEVDAHFKRQRARAQAEADYRNYDGLLPRVAQEIRNANAGLLPKEWLQEISREHKKKYARRLKTDEARRALHQKHLLLVKTLQGKE